MTWSDPQVQAATITSSVALLVAVGGIIATGLVHTRATKSAHEHAQEMFRAEAKERLRHGHLEDRKSAYVRLLVAIRENQDAEEQSAEAQKRVEVLEADDNASSTEVKKALEELVETNREVVRTIRDVIEALELVELLAPKPTRDAARALSDKAAEGEPTDETWNRFVNAVRRELGAEDGPV